MKKIDKIIRYTGKTPTITIEGYTGKLSWVSKHMEKDGSGYWEFIFEEKVKKPKKTILQKTTKGKRKFTKETGHPPDIVWLSKKELCKLNAEENMAATYGCLIMGMEIKNEIFKIFR